MALTDFGEAWFLNAFLQNGTYYLGLLTAPASDSTAGTEVSGGGYLRQAIAFSAPASAAPVTRISNVELIQFPTATASWGTVTSFAVYNAASKGNIVWYGNLTDSKGAALPKTVSPGDIFQVPTGALVLSID